MNSERTQGGFFSVEFAVQIFMDLFLCSRDSSGNSYHTTNSSLRLREEVAKSCCLFSRVVFCLEICFATIRKKYRALLGGEIGIFCLYSRKIKREKSLPENEI